MERRLIGEQRPRPPRFRDIAEEAGVGTATVERVLNGRGNVTPKTSQRVIAAARKLGYDRALPSLYHSSIRIGVVLVRPETPFFARLNLAFQKLAPTLDRSIILYRTFAEENTPDEVARRIESAASEREALIVVVQDHPLVIEALQAVDRRNVPLVLLVSDVGYGGRALYVGIDNESAGRTAGYFMRNALRGRSGNVVSLCHSGAYLTHRQRTIGFSQYFGDPDDRVIFKQCLETRDSEERARIVMSEALRADPDIVGIYNAGGGNAGVSEALERHRRPGDVIYIGHELSAATRRSLEKGVMLLTIDQVPELQARRAVETIETLIGLRDGAPDRSPIPFRIITPENLPG